MEKENLAMRDMVKGSLIEHYKKCGHKNCVCGKGKLHGPYWYLSYRESGRSILRYVDKKDLINIKRLAGNYKKFQSNITKINRINVDISNMMAAMRKILLSRRGK
ncbi:MAG: hypothetical protein KJ995_01115 [Candidatus Omnitrophica bacterium]|nr:hypothetical protein [Candidatus Omnitrophota bacterium]